MRGRSILILLASGIPALLLSSVSPQPAGAVAPTEFVWNGSFESGDFSSWATGGQTSFGDWYVTSAVSGPISGRGLDPPTDGAYQAVTDNTGTGSYILYQDVPLPSKGRATLRFNYWIRNEHSTFENPDTLDRTVRPNQQFRVDIMNPAVPIDVVSVGVLQNVLTTMPGDPTVVGATPVEVDLSAFLGQTIRLRFAVVNSEHFHRVGVDGVSIEYSPYEPVTDNLPEFEVASFDWGDFDGDLDLDLQASGVDGGSSFFLTVMENETDSGGDFSPLFDPSLLATAGGFSKWIDFDGDDRLDFLYSGLTPINDVRTQLYDYDGLVFQPTTFDFADVFESGADWADADGDGDLDLVLIGYDHSVNGTYLYESADATDFVEVAAGLPAISGRGVRWGDYDGDGDKDLLLVGQAGSDVYENDGGSFIGLGVGLPIVLGGACEWGDFDDDGDLDFALSGDGGLSAITKVYENDGGTFLDTGAPLSGAAYGNIQVGDLDNDGDLDLLYTGRTGTTLSNQALTRVAINSGGSFVEVAPLLQDVQYGMAAIGDYDSDGDLDVVLGGQGSGLSASGVTQLYRYYTTSPNMPPAAPGVVLTTRTSTGLGFVWSSGSDSETATPGLTYNVRAGTSSGSSDLVPSHSDPLTGDRRIVARGNADHNSFMEIALPMVSQIHWAVQTIDHGYAGSAFTPEQAVYLSPELFAIEDLPDDQGGWVRLSMNRSFFDDALEPQYPVTSYNIWRRVGSQSVVDRISTEGTAHRPGALDALAVVGPNADRDDLAALTLTEWRGRLFRSGTDGNEASTLPPGTWELVGNFAAAQQSAYTYVTPSVGDSTEQGGIEWSTYVVSAHTTTPSIWFATDPDSGYSIDNIAPGVPENFVVAGISPQGDVDLAWDPSAATDFQYFELHRGTDPDFTPDDGTLLFELTETTFTDVQAPQGGAGLVYKLIAIDAAGNASEAAETATGVVAVEARGVPQRFALYGSHPNPASGTATIRFDLPVAEPVSLTVFDARGRAVRSAYRDRPFEAGRHAWQWELRDDSGRRVPSGVYFYTLETTSHRSTRKAVVLD